MHLVTATQDPGELLSSAALEAPSGPPCSEQDTWQGGVSPPAPGLGAPEDAVPPTPHRTPAVCKVGRVPKAKPCSPACPRDPLALPEAPAEAGPPPPPGSPVLVGGGWVPLNPEQEKGSCPIAALWPAAPGASWAPPVSAPQLWGCVLLLLLLSFSREWFIFCIIEAVKWAKRGLLPAAARSCLCPRSSAAGSRFSLEMLLVSCCC